jgi:transcriptional regulator with XRE-family HTH domain
MAKRGPYKKQVDESTFAGYLIAGRIKKGLTQQDVAERLNVTKGSICRIERSNRRERCMQGYILYRIAEAYEVPLGEVLQRANWPQLLLMGDNQRERDILIHYLRENI